MLQYPLQRVWIVLLYVLLFADGLVRRFIRGENGVTFDRPSPNYDQKDFVPIEVKAGSLVVIHGDLIHQRSVHTIPLLWLNRHTNDFSLAESPEMRPKFCCSFSLMDYSCENQSSKSRHAYSLHVVDTEGCKWAEDNW